jgi:hypothetical protein
MSFDRFHFRKSFGVEKTKENFNMKLKDMESYEFADVTLKAKKENIN